MMNDHEPPKWATASAMRSPNVAVFFDDFVWIAAGAYAYELLRRVKLAAEDGEHVHAGVGFALDEHTDVAAIDLDADRVFQRGRVGLVRSLLEHGCEAEKLAVRWLVHDDFLVVFVYRCDANFTGNHDISVAAAISDFVDALARNEPLDLHLTRKHGEFVFVEQREQGNGAKCFWTGTHRGTSPIWKCPKHSTSSSWRQLGVSKGKRQKAKGKRFTAEATEVGAQRSRRDRLKAAGASSA